MAETTGSLLFEMSARGCSFGLGCLQDAAVLACSSCNLEHMWADSLARSGTSSFITLPSISSPENSAQNTVC